MAGVDEIEAVVAQREHRVHQRDRCEWGSYVGGPSRATLLKPSAAAAG
jgi:hypothetical protein